MNPPELSQVSSKLNLLFISFIKALCLNVFFIVKPIPFMFNSDKTGHNILNPHPHEKESNLAKAQELVIKFHFSFQCSRSE